MVNSTPYSEKTYTKPNAAASRERCVPSPKESSSLGREGGGEEVGVVELELLCLSVKERRDVAGCDWILLDNDERVPEALFIRHRPPRRGDNDASRTSIIVALCG
jgi:hypothetical protein